VKTLADETERHFVEADDAEAVERWIERVEAEDIRKSMLSKLLRKRGTLELLPAHFQQYLRPPAIHQFEKVEKTIFTSTSVRFESVEPGKVAEAMTEMPWDEWWRGSRVREWQRSEEGDVTFLFWPAWPPMPIKVRIDIGPPMEAEESAHGLVRRRTDFRSYFHGNFDGPSRFEIVHLPDGCLLRAIWEEIRVRGWARILPRSLAAGRHLAAERGDYPGDGSGYEGLRHRFQLDCATE
jgi:hypothetical protein